MTQLLYPKENCPLYSMDRRRLVDLRVGWTWWQREKTLPLPGNKPQPFIIHFTNGYPRSHLISINIHDQYK
jgi:hypothetical protein